MSIWRHGVVGAVCGALLLGATALTNAALAAAPQNTAVVYYTLLHNRLEGDENGVGKTQRVAMAVAEQTGSTLMEIKNTTKYPATYGETIDIASDELDNEVKLPMAAPVDVTAYQEIYVGMPCWWSSYPRVFATWFESQDFSGKTIYVFVTDGGSRYGRIIQDMQEALPDSKVVPFFEINDSTLDDLTDEELSQEVKEALDAL